MTSSSSSHHLDASSATSTPRAGPGSTGSIANWNGNGNGHGGNYHHHHPPPHAPPSQAQAHGVPCVRIMCSFGGRILPRPGDYRLRYVGGETRIVSVPRAASHALLTATLARLAPALFAPGAPEPSIRYQLPQDDLDSLICVCSDDDVDNLMDELHRLQGLAATDLKPPRLRLFIFAPSPADSPAAAAFGSVLAGTGDASIDQWFVDQLNAPPPSSLERARSDASENTDCLTVTGLEAASEEPSTGTVSEERSAGAASEEPPAPDPADAAQPKSDDDDDDVEPVTVLREPLPPYVPESSRWPAPPPQYVQQPMYYFPAPPVHYFDSAGRQSGYMTGPMYNYNIVGAGGNEGIYSSGSVGSVYGVPHPVQPFRRVIYAPPLPAADDHPAEGKPTQGGSQSHSS